MFCPNCGNNCGDAIFCADCGTKLNIFYESAEHNSFEDVMFLCDELLGEGNTPPKAPISDEEFVRDLNSLIQELEQEKLTLHQELEKRRPHTWSFKYQRARAGISHNVVCPKCGSNNISRNDRDFLDGNPYLYAGFIYNRSIMPTLFILVYALILRFRQSKYWRQCICNTCGKKWVPKKE